MVGVRLHSGSIPGIKRGNGVPQSLKMVSQLTKLYDKSVSPVTIFRIIVTNKKLRKFVWVVDILRKFAYSSGILKM